MVLIIYFKGDFFIFEIMNWLNLDFRILKLELANTNFNKHSAKTHFVLFLYSRTFIISSYSDWVVKQLSLYIN